MNSSIDENVEIILDNKIYKKKKLSSKSKIIIFISTFLLIVIILTGVFTLINDCRFVFYSKNNLQNLISSYDISQAKFVAHRGIAEDVPENTIDSFIKAAEDPNIYGIETDVWVTNDNGYICMHNKNSLKGISNVNDVSLDVALNTPLKENPNYYAPSLTDYLEICKRYNKTAFLEFKDGNIKDENLKEIVDIVETYSINVIYISFYVSKLIYVRSINSTCKLQALTFTGIGSTNEIKYTFKGFQKTLIENKIDLSMSYEFVHKSIINKFHSAGLEVNVWTVNNSKNAICLLADFGVDYITSDYSLYNNIIEFVY